MWISARGTVLEDVCGFVCENVVVVRCLQDHTLRILAFYPDALPAANNSPKKEEIEIE